MTFKTVLTLGVNLQKPWETIKENLLERNYTFFARCPGVFSGVKSLKTECFTCRNKKLAPWLSKKISHGENLLFIISQPVCRIHFEMLPFSTFNLKESWGGGKDIHHPPPSSPSSSFFSSIFFFLLFLSLSSFFFFHLFTVLGAACSSNQTRSGSKKKEKKSNITVFQDTFFWKRFSRFFKRRQMISKKI